VAVVGTGTDIGKTWVSARLLTTLRQAGVSVAARKPAQSFDPGDDPAGFDSAVLGAASGEPSETVCPPHRWYEAAMAPPMAAEALGRGRVTLGDLLEELRWPGGVEVGAGAGAEVGLVETAGGVRSPQSHDADGVALVAALAPDVVVLVADAGLGTINLVRLSVEALADGGLAVDSRLVVVLNRFDARDDLHRRNRGWLVERDGLTVVSLPGEEQPLADLVRGLETPAARECTR
jgi:dethiobiotin synthetase